MAAQTTLEDMNIIKTQDPAGAIQDGSCILVLHDGIGRSRILADAAIRTGAKRVLVIANKAYAGTVWGEDLERALEELLGTADGRIVLPQRAKDWGGEAARAAAASLDDGPVFYVITPNQAASAGAWCSAHGRSPFGLIAADHADMYANPGPSGQPASRPQLHTAPSVSASCRPTPAAACPA